MKNQTDYISPDSCNSLADLFLIRASQSPSSAAYHYFDKTQEEWHELSWTEMARSVATWRQAILNEKLEKGDRVAVMLANSPEWVAFEQAAFSLGLIVVPLYANDRPDNIAYILDHTEARLLLCPGMTYYEHLSKSIEGVKSLQRIITIENCKPTNNMSLIVCVTDWLPANITESTYATVTHETATIVYTSGTTGLPKGVMLSHQNILQNSFAALQCMDIYPNDTFLSFLPLSHMLERTAGYYLPMMAGASVAYARSIPDLAEDLLTLKPTVMVAVPRIFERIYGGIMATLQTKSPIAQKLFAKAVDTGFKTFLLQQNRGSLFFSLLLQPLLDVLVARKVRAKLGGRLRIIITGGAPLSADISKVFLGLGLPLYQGYGLTETSPVISVNRIDDNRPEGVGKPLPGIEVKVGQNDELLVRGSCVMQGYWKNKDATSQTIDADGWLRTGDQAVIEDGHIRIIGRLKDIIVLSNGENVALAALEMAISIDPLFEHVVVIGEGRPHLTLLAVLSSPLWIELAKTLDVPSESASLVLPEVRDVILARLEHQLSHFPGYVFIKDVSLSLTPWTVENGQLTPTLKTKRAVIEKQMNDEVEAMYF